MLLQRFHVWVAGEGKSINVWGRMWGDAMCKYVELGVTDGLKFWVWAGMYQAFTL